VYNLSSKFFTPAGRRARFRLALDSPVGYAGIVIGGKLFQISHQVAGIGAHHRKVRHSGIEAIPGSVDTHRECADSQALIVSGSSPAVRGRYFVRTSKFLPADVRGDYPSFRAAAAVKRMTAGARYETGRDLRFATQGWQFPAGRTAKRQYGR
jgi:hypothetical protein